MGEPLHDLSQESWQFAENKKKRNLWTVMIAYILKGQVFKKKEKKLLVAKQ